MRAGHREQAQLAASCQFRGGRGHAVPSDSPSDDYFLNKSKNRSS